MTPDVSDPGGLRRFSDNGSWHGLQADPSLSGTGLLVVIAAAFFLASKARAGELDTACTFREAANFPAGEIGRVLSLDLSRPGYLARREAGGSRRPLRWSLNSRE
ncbi:hypothetical protein BQ8482_110904 [Mesorhizobium delmotii]|uniref:Uncharacterized protein n=1 Tax=Mesorhizobium delmotii TaxID=1631247 RepID=A0A2P9ACY0_9HYPH|nr:hypothetical protein BQ8482_110904 [Mesorhizobium delmotii]